MATYCFFDVKEITDEEKMTEYRRKVLPTVEQYGGKYVVLGGNQEILEGDWQATFPVVIEFETTEQARQWYNAPEYQDLKALRLAATKGNLVLIEGTPNQEFVKNLFTNF